MTFRPFDVSDALILVIEHLDIVPSNEKSNVGF